MTYQFEEYPTRAALIEKLNQALIADYARRCPANRRSVLRFRAAPHLGQFLTNSAKAIWTGRG